jgi:hypothetical protein
LWRVAVKLRRPLYLLIGFFLAVISLSLLGRFLLAPRPGLSRANYDRIQYGMTRDEVIAILGEPTGPPADEDCMLICGDPRLSVGYVDPRTGLSWLERNPGLVLPDLPHEVWVGPAVIVFVVFGSDTFDVSSKYLFYRSTAPQGWLDKLGRWYEWRSEEPFQGERIQSSQRKP